MIGINRLNISWIDNNHASVQDPDTGYEFDITVRPKENMFVGGNPVKSRLYVEGAFIDEMEAASSSTVKVVRAIREHFQPVLNKLLNVKTDMTFSRQAGCGCSPGFIIQNAPSVPFDIWMKAK